MSRTLKHILNHWIGEFRGPESDWPSYVTVPFNLEEFCRENDAEIERLRSALRGVMNNLGVPQPGYPAPVAEAYDIADKALHAEQEKDTL